MKNYLLAVALLVAMTIPTYAAIILDEEGKVSMFGDVRIRGEADDSEKADGTVRSRERFRYRGRIGVKFASADNWEGQIRMATNSSSLNSPHINFDTVGSKGADIGIDQAFIKYFANENTTLVVGKTPLNFWNTTETFWDSDINIEGASFI